MPFESDRTIAGLDVDKVTGDVRDFDSLRRAFAGCRLVFHLAGVVSISRGQEYLLETVNVAGTRNVVRACLEAGVGRLAYTSSVHALREPPPGQAACEPVLFEPEALVGEYACSKARASQAVLEGVAHGLDAVLVFPSGVIGPYDWRPSDMGQLFLDFCQGRLRAYVDGEYDFVDVRDVVAGLLAAAGRGRRGEGYLLCGNRVRIPDLLRLLEGLTGRPRPRLQLPMRLARAAAVLAPAYYRLARQRPRFTSYSLHVLASNCLMDCSKAARELGYRARALRDTLEDTLGWFRQAGMLPADAVRPVAAQG